MVEHAAGGPEVAEGDQPGPADAQAGAPWLVDVAEVQVLGLVLLDVVEQGPAARLGPAGDHLEDKVCPGRRVCGGDPARGAGGARLGRERLVADLRRVGAAAPGQPAAHEPDPEPV